MKNLILLLGFTLLISCNKKAAVAPGARVDLSDFEVNKVEGSDSEYAILNNPDGGIYAEGMVKNGMQDGIWIVYFDEDGSENRIKTISNFVNGKLNGPYIEMNNISQMEKRITYLNNQIHGLYSEYKFGRPLKEFFYKNGILDGISKEYNDRGKLLKETSYKDGQLHGSIKQYDEDGNIVLEYEYKNGEKISGGIVAQ